MHELAHVLPTPGLVWGAFPMRLPDDTAPPGRRVRWARTLTYCRQIAHQALDSALDFGQLDAAQRTSTLKALRWSMRDMGLQPQAMARALGVACVCAYETLGLKPRPTQMMAAVALLDNRMAEMATGEGKTLAIALAAAVAALAGVPVHVVTANDYLAKRDAAYLGPFFDALGLSNESLAQTSSDEDKRLIYGRDVVYTTAKTLAFDFLRDGHALQGAQAPERVAAEIAGLNGPVPLMRGLCMALLDEADSILLDEADVPLVLSRSVPHAARRAFLWQALAVARQLEAGRHFTLHRVDRTVTLNAAGEERIEALVGGLGGPWRRPRYRREAIVIALAGLHAFHRNEQYLVRDGAIELLDEVTGRVAPGRVWSRGLHTVVALKEGLTPAPETETIGQTTFQRFFQRYWRLCGISGTLKEAGAELSSVYGAHVVTIPLHRPSQLRAGPARRFASKDALFEAAAERIEALQQAGRPVLVGTDSVADSERLSRLLGERRVAHHVLNALNDAEEAQIVALAGRSGQVTVATRMAGRGTDITLDDAALSAGGLHVLSLQNNASRRLDRQLTGRAARQGDPGSAEAWSSRETPATSWWTQWREERNGAMRRRTLLEQDLHWERRLAFTGRF